MLSRARRRQFMIGLGLAALMVATRGQHFPTLQQALPSASWAVFFLAGAYLPSLWAPAALFGVAALVDYTAVAWSGADAFCISPAYVGLLPAYGALWLAGRWYAGRRQRPPVAWMPFGVSLVAGTAVCELLSSGSFYFYSGRFTDPTLAEFGARFVRYFPNDLRSVAFWAGAAALTHLTLIAWRRQCASGTRLGR
jgi:hypothetical protein